VKYFRIFKEQCKLSFMSAAIFRANFILMLVQSIINSFMAVLSVSFIYGSVDYIAGWNKNEMIILICTSLIVNQLFRALINPNQLRFLASILNGAFDKMILKPINIIFQINSGSIDIPSLFSLVATLVILFMQISILEEGLEIVNIFSFILLLLNGLVILSSFLLILYSLAFTFIKVNGLNNVYYMMMSISEKPQEIFSQKTIILGFIFLIPTIPIANAPARALLNKSSISEILLYLFVGMLFFTISILAIKKGIKNYTSASS